MTYRMIVVEAKGKTIGHDIRKRIKEIDKDIAWHEQNIKNEAENLQGSTEESHETIADEGDIRYTTKIITDDHKKIRNLLIERRKLERLL